jgi:hypothetical protein
VDWYNGNGNDSQKQQKQQQRQLQGGSSAYWTTTSLGFANLDATLANLLKGLSGNPQAGHLSSWPESIPSSLHHYKFGLDTVMMGDPGVVGIQRAFNWTILDDVLKGAATYRAHTILCSYVHYPGTPLNLPKHLVGRVTTLQNKYTN